MRIEYVTHASFKVDNGKEIIVVDPFYFYDDFLGSFMCHFPPREMTLADLGKIDYLFSSHIHPDHCHEKTLEMIRDQVGRVILPGERKGLVKLYDRLGYPPATILDKDITAEVSEDLKLTVYWDGTVDTALVIETSGITILHQNDCRLSPDTLKKIASRHSVDFAFLLYTSSQSLFPFILDRSMEERAALSEEREMGLLNYQFSCIDILKPRVVIPYSMTMTYTQPAAAHVNTLWRLTPTTFCEHINKKFPDVSCIVMHPGDYIQIADDQFSLESGGHDRDYWGKTQAEFIHNVESYLDLNRNSLRKFVYGNAEEALVLLNRKVEEKVQGSVPKCIDGKLVRINLAGENTNKTLEADFSGGRINNEAIRDDVEPYLVINIPASLVEMMIKGEIDPFVALYSHEISFKLQDVQDYTPEDEGMIYMDTMLYLFAKTSVSEIAETDGMRKARRGSPYL